MNANPARLLVEMCRKSRLNRFEYTFMEVSLPKHVNNWLAVKLRWNKVACLAASWDFFCSGTGGWMINETALTRLAIFLVHSWSVNEPKSRESRDPDNLDDFDFILQHNCGEFGRTGQNEPAGIGILPAHTESWLSRSLFQRTRVRSALRNIPDDRAYSHATN